MDLHQPSLSSRPGARAGNALLTAVIVTALAAAIIASTADLSVASHRRVVAANHTSNALAALDVVLSRRQRIVMDMAADSRPEDFAKKTDNYGVDFIGPCEVRWKLEPIWAKAVDATGTEFAVFENPPPEGGSGAPANLVDNPGRLYLYRIAAEARINSLVRHDADNAANDKVRTSVEAGDFLARAQGVRYVSTTNSSALKYLLYWALRGPKGDLELTHGPATQLVGHIYSGGSIFFGSGTTCNDWLALKPSNGATTIGPPILAPAWLAGTSYGIGMVVKVGSLYYQAKDQHVADATNEPGSSGGTWKAYWEDVSACRVEGMDGVYRLSKQTLFSAFNGFPMASLPPAGFTVDGSYLLDALAKPGELTGNPPTASYVMPDVTNFPVDVYNATFEGRILNPARVRDPLATIGLVLPDDKRVVNVAGSGGLTAVALRGVDELPAGAGTPPINAGNDSRDTTRVTGSGFTWASHSLNSAAPGFNRQVRTKTNGLVEQPLLPQFLNRYEEPQTLVYYDLDGDPTSDEHEYAMPQFISTGGGLTTDLAQRLVPAPIDGVNLDCVENPGTALKETLGGNLYMARRADYRGWLVVNKDGTAPAAEPVNGVGIVIRERPRPETTYFTPTKLPGVSDPLYMPFAYGHVRASVWPMTGCDVAAQMSNQLGTGTGTWTSDFATTTVAGITTTNVSQSYSSTPSASVNFKSGTQPGPSFSGGSADSGSGMQRFDYLTRDSWRFIALGRPKNTGVNGLNATIWNDESGTTWLAPFGGRPVHSFVASTINVNYGAAAPTGSVGVGTDRFSIRWRGFIKPQYTENYFFYADRAAGHCGVRVWVDDVLVIDKWSESAAVETSPQARPLAADQLYSICVEAYDGSGNFGLHVDWSSPSRAKEIIPNDRLFTQTMPEGFDWNTFTAVEARLDSLSAPNGKAGLMLRPDVGISPVQDGRNPYVALCYTKSRGVFAQIRGDRSRVSTGSQNGYFVGNADFNNDAASDFETPMSDVNGEIAQNPNHASVQRAATLTPVVDSTPFSSTSGTQTTYTVYTPGNNNPVAAPAALGAWPSTKSGTSQLSGANWTDISGSSRTALQRTPDNPFSISEGSVDRVWRGPVTLRVQRFPREQSTRSISPYIRWHLGNTQPANADTQRFRWRGSAGDPWPAAWPDKDVNADDLDDSSSVKRLFLFSDRTGDRTSAGTFSANNQAFALGCNYTPPGYWQWYGYNSTAILGNTGDIDHSLANERGGIIYKLLYSSTDTTSTWWYEDSAPADGLPDGPVATWDKSVTYGDAKTVYYINSGGTDTRPKVYNGATFVRYLTQAETLSLMDATYGAGHVAVNTAPGTAFPYPVCDAPLPAYKAGDPAASMPTVPVPALGYTRLAADPTAITTTLTVAATNNGTRFYSAGNPALGVPGDVLGIHSAAGTEYVVVTAVPTTSTVTVTRGQRGTAALDHPNGALVVQVAMPVSAVGGTVPIPASAALAPGQTYSVRTLASAITIQAGDVLQIGNEQLLVTGTTAASGSIEPTITVTRGWNGTLAEAHPLNSPIITPLPVMGSLSVAHTNAVTTLTMSSTARLAVNDILQVGNELMRVEGITSGTQATVTRGFASSTAVAQVLNATVFLTVGKTFAVNRGRTVSFEINPWISAGAAPTKDWRDLGYAPDAWGWTREHDWGWYWSGVKAFAPWKEFWSSIDRVGTTGGIASRAYDKSWTTYFPLNAVPSTNIPQPATETDWAFPTTNSLARAPGSRFTDDQPVNWGTATNYAVGDLVWNGSQMYKAKTAHLSAAATTPGTGGSWTTAWEQTYLWLRIERVPTTTRVRMLYALDMVRPDPATNPEKWHPLLTTPDANGAAAPKPGRVDGDDGDQRELQIDLAPWFKQGRATVVSNVGTNLTISAPTTGSFAPGDIIQAGNELMLITGGAGTVFTVCRNWGGTLLPPVTDITAGKEVVQECWRGNDLLVGLCAQSGGSGTIMSVDASNLRIEQNVAGNPEITETDWQLASPYGGEDDTRYLCSQYQVFWGPYDITEDFFHRGQDGLASRIATEEWIYNTRYFWSQPRWWESFSMNDEKDPNYIFPNNAGILSNRELLAKTTMLSINMRALQDYLTSTNLSSAIQSWIPGVGPTQALLGADYLLRDRVREDGLLIHASRYNRYPWNPNLNGSNPWNPSLPNANGGATSNESLAALPTTPVNLRAADFNTILPSRRAGSMTDLNTTGLSGTFSDLMPYALGAATTPGALSRVPAFKPQDFHHAFRITDAESIDWSYGLSSDYARGGVSFFTPNQLYIKGDVNTTAHSVGFNGVPATKANKLALYCDTAIFLSKGWMDGPFRVSGLVMDTTSRIPVTGSGTLGMNQGTAGVVMPAATPSTYQFALLTHTIPTTRASVRMGEASSFISTFQYLEDWAGKDMTYVGAVVVMDTRRYSSAYLLDQPKLHGMSPFGWMTASSPAALATWVTEYSKAGSWPLASAGGVVVNNNGTNMTIDNRWMRTAPFIQQIYGAPNRNLFYNPDFFYKPGQPPLMPFGTSAAGMGGWSRIVK